MLIELKALLAKLGVGLAVKGIFALHRRIRYFPGWGKRRYLKDLRRQVAEMPFIYRDLPLDLMGDFVEGDFFLVSPRSWNETQGHYDRDASISPRRILSHHARFVVLGDAGIGKTTLFRFLAISLIDLGLKPPWRRWRERTTVPVYVPLKALSVVNEYPILSYIQETYAYFSGNLGLFRLRRLARRKQLMLLLDGYDEIPLVGGAGALQREILSLFSPAHEIRLGRPVRTWAFYHDFIGNRVGLSSRREFFLANPMELRGAVSFLSAAGLGDSRVRLVANIFNRYRVSGGDFFRERLDEEGFMQGIERAGRHSLQKASRNPLFLTVMCYVYVNAIRQGEPINDVWRAGEFALIDRCIDLLLRDIDEYKARGLPETQRNALMGRRGVYRDEKKAFLRFVASEALFDDQAVLTYPYMQSKARQFFGLQSGAAAADILDGLESEDATSNILLQLIFSGLIALTRSAPGTRTFDFPHRRFRELLAADHLDSDEGLARILQCIASRSLSEFIPVYAERTGKADVLLRAAIASLSTEGDGYALGKLIVSLLRLVPGASERSKYVMQLIELLVAVPKGKRLPRALLDFLEPSDSLVLRLESWLPPPDEASAPEVRAMLRGCLWAVKRQTSSIRPFLHAAARRRSGMVGALLSDDHASHDRFTEMLHTQFPDRDIARMTPEWADALLEFLGEARESAKVKVVLVHYFGLAGDAEMADWRTPDIEDLLCTIAGRARSELAADFAWVAE